MSLLVRVGNSQHHQWPAGNCKPFEMTEPSHLPVGHTRHPYAVQPVAPTCDSIIKWIIAEWVLRRQWPHLQVTAMPNLAATWRYRATEQCTSDLAVPVSSGLQLTKTVTIISCVLYDRSCYGSIFVNHDYVPFDRAGLYTNHRSYAHFDYVNRCSVVLQTLQHYTYHTRAYYWQKQNVPR